MNAARAEIAAIVRERLGARVVVARDDGSARDFEELPRFAGVRRGRRRRRASSTAWGANRLEADLLTDGKTGGFLDQADNHAAVAALAPAGRARARRLHATTAASRWRSPARGGEVLAIDEDAAAVERAAANARRNGLANLRVERANAFDLLRELEGARRALRRRGAGSARAGQARAAPQGAGRRRARLQGADPARRAPDPRRAACWSPAPARAA